MIEKYIHKTKEWLYSFVIHHNLCPFARKPYLQKKIRYQVYEGGDFKGLGEVLQKELILLSNTLPTEIETTILIIPQYLQDFSDYLDFVEFSNDLIFALHLDGVLQIASFHPEYQFEGTTKEELSNYTNRAPYPLLHLIREESIEQALLHYENPEQIPENNIKLMQQLGRTYLEKIVKGS